MDMVSLSKDQFMLVKRLFLNVLSGNEKFFSCNRSALKESNFPERFLIERAWVIRGAKLCFTGTREEGRKFLDELQSVDVSFSAAREAVDEQTPASPRLMRKLMDAIEREERRPGVWSFPCVFRLSAAELAKMLSLEESDMARVASAVREVIRDGPKMAGVLEMTSSVTFVYTRKE